MKFQKTVNLIILVREINYLLPPMYGQLKFFGNSFFFIIASFSNSKYFCWFKHITARFLWTRLEE